MVHLPYSAIRVKTQFTDLSSLSGLLFIGLNHCLNEGVLKLNYLHASVSVTTSATYWVTLLLILYTFYLFLIHSLYYYWA